MAVGLSGLLVSVLPQIDLIRSAGYRFYSRYFARRPPLIELEPYYSPVVSGGHNPEEICNPQRKKYQEQYPDYSVELQTQEENSKDWMGHVSYRYQCYYRAVLK